MLSVDAAVYWASRLALLAELSVQFGTDGTDGTEVLVV